MNILGTLLDIPGKTKDGLNARRDLADLKIRPELTPINGEKKIFIPPACYTLTKKEKRFLLKSLSEMKVPRGYSSNITNLVSIEDSKLNDLKSHDCHVLLQQLLPVAIRFVLPKHVRYAITHLCLFLNSICNKVIDVTQVEKLQEDIVITLCLLEKYFPPSFFTIMVHLTVHLVREVKLCGPFICDGCIHLKEFLCGVDPIGLGCQKLRDNSDYSELGRPLSSGVTSIPERELLYQAHPYVLENTVDVETELATGDVEVSDNLRWIAHGPHPVVTTYNSYAINGCHYHTKSHDKNKTVQNSGVSLVAKTMQIHSYTMELPTDEDLTLGVDEVEIGLDTAHTDHLEQVDASKNEKKKTRGLTLMHDVTRIKTMVANHAYIDTLVVGAFVIDGRSKKAIMKTTGVSFRQFKSWLTTQYIIPFMDEPQLLIDPHSLYAHIIDKPVWQEFVRSRMSLEFQKKGSFEEQDFGRANMWKKARTKKDGGYINEDVQQVVDEIDEILDKAPNEESSNDALTQALGTSEYGGRVRGVGGFITPTVYFHQAKLRKSNKVDTTQQIINENEALRKRIRELEQKFQSIPTSEHGSCSKSKVQEKEKVLENVVKEKKEIATSVPPVSLTSKKKVVEEEEVIATTPMTKNEVKSSRPMTKEVEVTSEPSNLPIQLKYILRYAERVMVDGSSFSFQLPLELFGISRKSYVLREDVIDFCNMQKVKTLSMVAYITYLYSLIIDLKKVSKYIFVDPSLISAGHSTREIRARNLCSRLMTSKQDQLVVAPYNPGDHWSLVIINPYDDVVYHLDSLRTSSRDDIKYVTNMALTIFQSQKNLKKTRKTTFWKAVKCPLQVGTVECGYYVMRYMREILSKDTSIITDAIDTRNSYSQLELDEVRVEWAEFLSRSVTTGHYYLCDVKYLKAKGFLAPYRDHKDTTSRSGMSIQSVEGLLGNPSRKVTLPSPSLMSHDNGVLSTA
ncbi:transposase [Cucumis melo var. makuwa]|uniref:Transposase n=1 Tax=Cucumis melo var. makuwa TaxID=1194695 RepID=A0A5A7SLX6_CUCMM|nr:transposase [Cucumis melo var. makuwa]